MTDGGAGGRSGSDLSGAFSGDGPSPTGGPAVPISSLVVLVRNEWNENHVSVGLFGSSDDAVDWVNASSEEPGNRGYTYAIMPLIPPDEYVDGEWRTPE